MKAPVKKFTTSSTATALTFIVALVLSGCASSPFDTGTVPTKDVATTQPADDATEEPFDEDDDDDGVDGGFGWTDPSQGSDEIDFGSFDIGTTVPKDFPKNIPLYNGTVTQGSGFTVDGERSWVVAMTVPDIKNTYLSVSSALTSAGFAELMSTVDEESAFGLFSGNGYSIMVSAGTEGNITELGYIVSNVEG